MSIKQTLLSIYNQRHRLHDIRFVGMLIFLVIVLLISWSGVKTIGTNYTLQKQIAALKQENQVQQLQNEDLQLQNEYLNTNQYLELSARENFGLGNSGETELLVPKNIALAQLSKVSNQIQSSTVQQGQPTYIENFNNWINFLFHKQPSISAS